ncbi:MAG: TRAP transporter fused permease subunit [Spirochaetaceae bacterium]|nr:MAG: TRAP transporter fused permease subunit [Spirochaetaceae bacterium]
MSLVWLAFQLYIGLVRPLHPLLQNSFHLMMALALIFCYFPTGKKWWQLVDVAIVLLLLGAVFHIFTNFQRLQTRIAYVTPVTTVDIIVAIILVAAVLEAVRRSLGYSLFVFMVVVIAYGFLGRHFPGIMRFRGISFSAFTDLMVMTTSGLFGTPLGTSVNTLYYFILFGFVFSELGGGQILLDIGLRFSNTASGGPGKAAVIASSLVGTISGSAVANVSSTGVITIPFMKKVGYKPEQAAAIESIASTGGQIMPPIMGVGAFIMAELLGRPYGQIALAALIPALVYYFSIFILVDFLGRRQHTKSDAVKIVVEKILPRLYLLIPILFVIFSIFQGASLMRTALRGTTIAIFISFFSSTYRLNFHRLFEILTKASMQIAKVAVPTAAAGVVIGIVIHSGFAQRLSNLMGAVGGGGTIFPALLLAMIGCVLLGMALPTVAAYIISAILFAPALTRLGIPPLAAHMFLFYFGVIAQITPPVCLASFTAAGIAEADTWKTAWTAFFYALVTFLIPYVFVYKNELLLMGGPMETIVSTGTLLIGTLFLVASVSSYLFVPIYSWIPRILLLTTAILTIVPETATSVLGISGGLAIVVYYFIQHRKLAVADAPVEPSTP